MGGYPSVLVGSVSVCHFKINEQTYSRPRLRESTYTKLVENKSMSLKNYDQWKNGKRGRGLRVNIGLPKFFRCFLVVELPGDTVAQITIKNNQNMKRHKT